MDAERKPGEISAAAHAFPDRGLAAADQPPLGRPSPAELDDPAAVGRDAAVGAPAGGEVAPAAGGGARVGPQRRRDRHMARGRASGEVSREAGVLGVLAAYGAEPQAGGSDGVAAPAPDATLAGGHAGAHADGGARARSGARAGVPAHADAGSPGHLPGPGQARRQVWTDLAVEAIRPPERIPGIAVEEDHRGPLQISRVRIESEEAELRVGKRRGRYITLEAPGLRRRNAALQEDTARALADELRSFLPEASDAEILVVGLGNWNATPDALGPRVVGDLLITRHLREQVPEDLRGGLRSLCAIAPGVLGTTGIETGEIIRAIVDRVHPDAMIAVDALASRSIDRIAATIQLADTGIHPGSGVGNDRGDLSAETLGVPVVAIGVPTVVHAFTIASDTVDLLIQRIPRRAEFAGLRAMNAEEKRRLIAEVLTPSVGDLMVTPKEVDVLIEDMSRIIAAGINAAVHPKIAQQPTLF